MIKLMIKCRFFPLNMIGNLFSVKDPVPRGLRAGVVYKFLCAGCSAC